MPGNADNILIGAAVVNVNGTDIGFTKNGQTVRYKPEFVDVVADQANGVVRKARSLERMYVRFTLLEVSLEQLRLAMMQPAANLPSPYDTLTIGVNDACFIEQVELELVGIGPGSAGVCGTRTFTFPVCVITDNEKMYEMKRDQEVNFDMEFEILKDSSGAFGTIVDS